MSNNKLHNDDELVQYFIVNKDLNMSIGKIAAQCSHVATIVAIKQYDSVEEDISKQFKKWYYDNQKKVVLQAHQKDLEKLVEKGFYYIRDNGLTEIQPNSLTCVSLGVMTRTEAKPYVKRLQLLR
jgi:peptidyl-tRNA hydrolase